MATKFFNLNFVKILRFCEETQLEKKLIGFTEKFYAKDAKDAENTENKIPLVDDKNKKKTEKQPDTPVFTMKSPILQIKQLLKALSSPFYDGRILLTIDSPRSALKFILLNPSICFEDIIANARSVILAGGTMKPFRDFEELIGSNKPIEHFSCGHVIPKGNLVSFSMGTGPTGAKLEFSFNFRDNPKIVILAWLFILVLFIQKFYIKMFSEKAR